VGVGPDPTGQTGLSWTVNGQNVFEYAWDPIYSSAHSVVGVGYIDTAPGLAIKITTQVLPTFLLAVTPSWAL